MTNAVHGPAGTIDRPDGTWLEIERQTLSDGTVLPLFHRSQWAATLPHGSAQLLPVAAAGEHQATSLLLQRHRSRVLPGHTLLRVQRFGHGWNSTAWPDILHHLSKLARQDRSALRLNIGIFLRSGHEQMRSLLQQLGFTPVAPRSYRHTLTLPVDQTDEALLAPRKSLRKRLREVEKAGAVVRVLTEAHFAQALTALQQTAMQRSGGSFRIADWPAVLKLSAKNPKLSRVVGLFASADATQPADLLGFAWGCMHGDHAEYRAAGSAELGPQHRGLSISYPLTWNLIQWTRDNGGTWFDMGGVTLQEGSDEPLAGISAAKRVFSETVEEVGEEWVLEPRPWKSRLADRLGTAVQALRGKAAS